MRIVSVHKKRQQSEERGASPFAHHFPKVENNDSFSFTFASLNLCLLTPGELVHMVLHLSDCHNVSNIKVREHKQGEEKVASAAKAVVAGFSAVKAERKVQLLRADRANWTNLLRISRVKSK